MILKLRELDSHNGFVTEVLSEEVSVFGCGTLAIYNAKKYLGAYCNPSNQVEMYEIKKIIGEVNGLSEIARIEEYLLEEMGEYIKSVGSYKETSSVDILNKLINGSVLLCALEVPVAGIDIGHIGVMKVTVEGLFLDNIQIGYEALYEIKKSSVSEYVELRRMED